MSGGICASQGDHRPTDQRRGDADTGDHGPATGSFHHTGAGGFPDSGEGRADFPAAEQRSHRAGNQRKTLREHYQVRAVLEKAACELCCENGADLSSVKNCIDTAEEALERNDVTDYANQNQSFHYEIWKAAGNGKLEKMLGELWNGLSLGLNSTEEEYARRSQKEHQQIYAALEKRDAALAGKEMEKHIYRSMEDVLTRYQ